MKKGLTELVFILDKSGSMAGLEADTVGGFNAMIDRQKKEEGAALVTTVLFANSADTVHDRVPVEKVAPMDGRTYSVGGCTALLDAVGQTAERISLIHKYARIEDVPEKTVFVITTDGMENASRSHTYETVKRIIEERKKNAGWEFIFLGANIDAAKTAGTMGIDSPNAVNYVCDKQGTAVNFSAVGKAISSVRSKGKLDNSWREEIDRDFAKRK